MDEIMEFANRLNGVGNELDVGSIASVSGPVRVEPIAPSGHARIDAPGHSDAAGPRRRHRLHSTALRPEFDDRFRPVADHGVGMEHGGRIAGFLDEFGSVQSVDAVVELVAVVRVSYVRPEGIALFQLFRCCQGTKNNISNEFY